MRTAKPGPDSTVKTATPDLAKIQLIIIKYHKDKLTFIFHRLLQALQELFQYFLLTVAWGIQAVGVPEMVG